MSVEEDYRHFVLPDLGEGIAEGELAKWFVERGASLEEDDPIVEIVTDKSSVIISAPARMIIAELLIEEGAIAKVGEPLFRYRESEQNKNEAERASEPIAHVQADEEECAQEAPASAPREAIATAVGDLRESAPGTALYEALPIKARRGLELTEAHRDSALAKPPRSKKTGSIKEMQNAEEQDQSPSPDEDPLIAKPRAREPISPRRKIIAERMRESRDGAVHATLVEECEFTELIKLRDELRAAADERRGFSERVDASSRPEEPVLSFLPFFIKAVALTLDEFPRFAARVKDDHFEIDPLLPIGLAVDSDRGLLVPVIQGARSQSLFSLAREVKRLADGARADSLRPHELRGSVFTITSLGKLGGLFGTPVLNPPEFGILGIHRARPQAVVRGGELVVRTLAYLSLSFDHQWIDGAYAARFLNALIARLERPVRLIAE